MDEYKFSVSICVYGGDNPKHFDIAMESIFNQTLPPDEVVLVVDGPVKSGIDSVIHKYESMHEQLKTIRLEKNGGLGNARRIALSHCTYNLVAMMDADDISRHNRFEKEIDIFRQNPLLSIVGGQISEFIDCEDNIIGIRNVPTEEEKIKRYMKKRCPMNHMTVMLKKQDIESVGGYIDWHYNEDYYLWIRMALANLQFANSQDILVNVRVGTEMYQRRGGWKYFKSEAGIQRLMLKNKMISIGRYAINITERFILQVVMPNWLRGIIFKKFARKEASENE